MKVAALAPFLIGLASCASHSTQPAADPMREPAAVLTLDAQDSQLTAAFNEHCEQAQLLVILSPT